MANSYSLGARKQTRFHVFDDNSKTTCLSAKTCKKHPSWNIFSVEKCFLNFLVAPKLRELRPFWVQNTNGRGTLNFWARSLKLWNFTYLLKVFQCLFINFLLSLIVLEIAKISVSVPSIPEACPWLMRMIMVCRGYFCYGKTQEAIVNKIWFWVVMHAWDLVFKYCLSSHFSTLKWVVLAYVVS